MKRFLLFYFIFFCFHLAYPQSLVKVGDGYSGTSVNTTVFRKCSVVSFGDYQYTSYYDQEGYVVVGKRFTSSEKWEIRRTQYKGNVKDAHNVISIMVDGEGYVHLSFDHHGNPLRYCRSVAPYSLTFGDEESMIGRDEEDVTYPEFYRMPDGELLFAYRSGSSGKGNMVLNKYDLRTHCWNRVKDVLIDGEGERNAYWQMCVDKQGVIHLSWVWREAWMVETNHDLCYARSVDGGYTWSKSDGTLYSLPITASNAEYIQMISQGSDLINQTSMTTDEEGHPFIATYWRAPNDSIPQYKMIWNDGDGWHTQQISQRTTPFSLSGGGTKMIPVARPQIAVRGGNVYCIFRDEEHRSKVSLSHTENVETGIWETTDLTDFSVEAWEPSYDTVLWQQGGPLHVFIQHTRQGDGEQAVQSPPTGVYIMEVAL